MCEFCLEPVRPLGVEAQRAMFRCEGCALAISDRAEHQSGLARRVIERLRRGRQIFRSIQDQKDWADIASDLTGSFEILLFANQWRDDVLDD